MKHHGSISHANDLNPWCDVNRHGNCKSIAKGTRDQSKDKQIDVTTGQERNPTPSRRQIKHFFGNKALLTLQWGKRPPGPHHRRPMRSAKQSACSPLKKTDSRNSVLISEAEALPTFMVIMWVQGMTFKEWTRSRSQQDTMVDFFKRFKKTCDPFGGSSFGDIAPSKRESHSWGNMHVLYGIQDSEHKGPKRGTILETRDPRTIETS